MAPADTGLEIELKFQVPLARQAALERALATKTAERVPLRARYFDTPDGRLAAAQLALRLRREGDAWVQTLKGRGDGLMQRLEHEVRRPPEAGDPPPLDLSLHAGTEAGAALAAALKGAAQAPVVAYGTEIQRLKRVLRHGGARVELALDTGQVIAGGARAAVCELEFELLSGPVSGLLDLASRWADRFRLVADPATKSERAQWLAQGRALRPVAVAEQPALAPGMALGVARAAMIGAALRHALPNAAALTAGAGAPEHVHQLRVALRRLRTVLRAFGPPDTARDAVIAGLFSALGGRRDLDVLAQTLAPAWAAAQAAGLALPPAPAADRDRDCPMLADPAVTRLWLGLIALARPDAEVTSGLLPFVPARPASGRPGASSPAVAAEALPDRSDPAEPWDGPALDRLRRWHRQVRRQAARWPELDDAGRHRLRKRLKRLRYLLEFAAPLLARRAAERETAALRRLQDALGRWNDLVLARASLAAPATPAAFFAAGWLAREAEAVELDCALAAQRWRRLKGAALVARRRKRH